jgi:hypothetical protein
MPWARRRVCANEVLGRGRSPWGALLYQRPAAFQEAEPLSARSRFACLRGSVFSTARAKAFQSFIIVGDSSRSLAARSSAPEKADPQLSGPECDIGGQAPNAALPYMGRGGDADAARGELTARAVEFITTETSSATGSSICAKMRRHLTMATPSSRRRPRAKRAAIRNAVQPGVRWRLGKSRNLDNQLHRFTFLKSKVRVTCRLQAHSET